MSGRPDGLPFFLVPRSPKPVSFAEIRDMSGSRNYVLNYLTLIFACQLAGETIVRALGLLFPGPVVGMVLLFGFLSVRRRAGHPEIPEALAKVADALLSNLSLLFVPAGVGVMVHLGLLKSDLVPLGTAVFVSTTATIAVTGLVMRWLQPRMDGGKDGASAKGGEGENG